MSEFLFIIPAGWTKISTNAIEQIGSSIGDWLQVNDYNSLSEALIAQNEIAPDMRVWEAKFFNGEVLAVRIG